MQDIITLAHGSGGTLSHALIRDVFIPHFANQVLATLEDAAALGLNDLGEGTLAFTTDSFVVKPLFFPGGDIGKLAVCGTVNDLAMRGARPLWLSAGFILEEGLPLADLERIVASMAKQAKEAGVTVVAGDTKVVERGSGDGVFINTAGIGWIPAGIDISAANARPGDVVLINGTMGDHGLTIMTQREGLQFESSLASDCAPLNGLVEELLAVCPYIHTLRDPTRGGVATALNEIAERSGVGIALWEEAVPIHPAVQAASELLGLDPFYVANEGKLLAVVPEAYAEVVLATMRKHPLGSQSALIGRVVEDHPGRVVLQTAIGTRRLLGMLSGELLPRIC